MAEETSFHLRRRSSPLNFEGSYGTAEDPTYTPPQLSMLSQKDTLAIKNHSPPRETQMMRDIQWWQIQEEFLAQGDCQWVGVGKVSSPSYCPCSSLLSSPSLWGCSLALKVLTVYWRSYPGMTCFLFLCLPLYLLPAEGQWLGTNQNKEVMRCFKPCERSGAQL